MKDQGLETSCRTARSLYSRGVPSLSFQPGLPRRAAGLALALSILSGMVATRAAADDLDLRALRTSFRGGLLGAVLPEKKAHAAILADMEKKLASARDYANAIKVRDERLALEQEVAVHELELAALGKRASGNSASLPRRIVLSPHDATLSGLKLNEDGALTGWDTAGRTATWKLPGLPEGGYEVWVKYNCAEGGSVNLEVRENFFLLRGKVKLEAGAQAEKNLGTLRIRHGDGALILMADGIGQSVKFRIVAIELSPVSR